MQKLADNKSNSNDPDQMFHELTITEGFMTVTELL